MSRSRSDSRASAVPGRGDASARRSRRRGWVGRGWWRRRGSAASAVIPAAGPRRGRMAPLGLAAADHHADGSRAPAAARHRRGARLASSRSAAPTPTASRQYYADNPDLAPILDNLSCSTCTPRSGSRRSTSCCSSRSSAASSPHETSLEGPARARRARLPASSASPTSGTSTIELHPRRRCRFVRERGRRTAIEVAADQLQAGRLPRRAVRRGTPPVGVGRARLRARDRQPRVPHRPHRRAASPSASAAGSPTPARASSSRAARSSTRCSTTRRSTRDASSTRRRLTPYSLTLDEFAVTYQPAHDRGAGQAGDFAAQLTTLLAGRARRRPARCASTIRSRSPATASI